MTISDILQHPVLPFEIEDVKLVKLFSFFLHSAPTIESATAISMEAARLDQNWMSFITSYPKESWLVIAPNCTFGAYMIKAGLDGNAVVSRRKKGVADGLFCREIDGLFCRSSPDIIVRRRCVLSHKRRGWLQPSPSFRYSRNLALQDELYHPVINNGPAVLVCVDKRLGTGPVNQSRDAG